MMKFCRTLCNLAKSKGKTLKMREEHIIQRHSDGCYTVEIKLIPLEASDAADGVDRVIIHRSRGIVGHQA